MNIEQIREYFLSFEASSESLPFDETTLVFKVGSKMFGLLSLERPFSINLKCNPERAIELRETYPFIIPGYHMNKQHWNTITSPEDAPNDLICELIQHSRNLVIAGMSKKERQELGL